MLLTISDIERLDHRRADRAQLIHDDQVITSPNHQRASPTSLPVRPGSHPRSASSLPTLVTSSKHEDAGRCTVPALEPFCRNPGPSGREESEERLSPGWVELLPL